MSTFTMISPSKSEKNLDLNLKKFSLHLLPSESHLEEKRETADMLFELLRTKSRYMNGSQIQMGGTRRTGYVDRCYIAGSEGKQTQVGITSNIDLVIFVNDKEPPFNQVLQDFASILRRFNKFKIENLRVRPSLNAIEFQLNNFDVHIFPAPNYVNHHPQKPKLAQLAACQAESTYKELSCYPDKSPMLRAGLCETQLKFIRNQNSFVHELIRLCKYWDKTVGNVVNGYINDRSTLIELIAIKVGNDSEAKWSTKTCVMLRAFETFLDFIENFEQLEIEFDFNPLSMYRAFKEKYVDQYKQITKNQSRPFVIDPTNPFENLAKGVNLHQMKQFKEAANKTKLKVKSCIQDSQGQSVETIFETSV